MGNRCGNSGNSVRLYFWGLNLLFLKIFLWKCISMPNHTCIPIHFHTQHTHGTCSWKQGPDQRPPMPSPSYFSTDENLHPNFLSLFLITALGVTSGITNFTMGTLQLDIKVISIFWLPQTILQRTPMGMLLCASEQVPLKNRSKKWDCRVKV